MVISTRPCRILILNNLYPPQELGGYGRSLFDFASNLRKLGHQLFVLTSDAPYLGGDTSNEVGVDRRLKLLGSYENGFHPLSDSAELQRRQGWNSIILNQVLSTYKPVAALVGNIDMLSPSLLNQIIDVGVHCWHHHGFASSTVPVDKLPCNNSLYHPLGGSYHTSSELARQMPTRDPIPVVYTGAEVDRFLNLPMLPLKIPLRIAYAGLMMGSKDPHILWAALIQLKNNGIALISAFA